MQAGKNIIADELNSEPNCSHQYATATAQPGLAVSNIIETLPPLAEQHRIVAKIEDLFAQIEPLAKALSTPM